MIDLRSDTVTKPTPAMRDAMANAVVGDDVYAEDPTVNRLQDTAAEMTGFEAALFVPTGTMSNQIALAAHAQRGYEVISPEGAHIYEYEIGAMSVISGLVPRLIPAPAGIPDIRDIKASIHRSIHQAPTGLITLENTHNKAGGTVVPVETCQKIRTLADAENLPFHLDGARAFNAATALKTSIEHVCAPFHSASLCLSKGLAAPAGTLLVGSKNFIQTAHRYRKMLGGGMRQAGVLAAAGLIALTHMSQRLQEDHDRARAIAEAISKLEFVSLDLSLVQSNLVYFSVPDASKLVEALAARGVLCSAMSATSIRLVTHYEITDEDVQTVIRVMTETVDAGVLA